MSRSLSRLVIVALGLSAAAPTRAQTSGPMVVTVDPGPTRVNQRRLLEAVERTTEREVIRLTDERAPEASGRLTIAFSPPDRWVLRYEAHGQVGWTSDRIRDPRAIRDRLAELSRSVVQHVETSEPVRRRRAWDDDLIVALQNELVDPFANEPRREYRPIPILWSEVVDPFAERPPRADTRHVWSEVLDPWSSDPRQRR